ncbi:alpha/beta-hydrolase [Mollisia scopiformis]|uniref:Alpha/beta-hydrolase n=1 Tax=Mollisia scopiformis TaxID=149040 RepID=A0A194XSN5_MOLSC|nr:alpha/beta-hydrolase [Mollisia scopiformis]KUJ23315.1 alpha/beta-hydrolase [Mollisia scopiformis]
MFSLSHVVLAIVFLSSVVTAQYFPPVPEGITTIKSSNYENATISYKETFICETTPGVRGWSGYVHLPADASRDYPINTFFWFFEARNRSTDTPLAIWLNGGPGASSVASVVSENGPCNVLADSNSTEFNPWSWNNEVDMLYIDQPVQVGFSYDRLANGTLDALSTSLLPVVADFSISGVPMQNDTLFVGTFPSLNSSTTATTSTIAASAVWEFLQAWLNGFPFYESCNDKGLGIWGASYGGHWVTALAGFIEDQNDRITAGTLEDAFLIKVDTVGIINGQVDFTILAGSYPDMAYNNTYGFQAISEVEYLSAKANVTMCENLFQECRDQAAFYDPENLGNVTSVNSLCVAAYGYCALYVEYVYLISGHDSFDIGHTTPDSEPTKYELGYLNQHWVQAALGVPLNFTYQNMVVYNAVMASGDIVRGRFPETLGDLLDRGVQVTLMYGDRDYICNWISGERTSLALNSTLSSGFQEAGYVNITTNDTYYGGVVRQHGNLSFSRVFDAAHEVAYYQPETAYRVFTRAMFHTDIATGGISIADHNNYSTTGPSSGFHIKNTMPDNPPNICYTYMATTTCTTDQLAKLQNGTAVVEDWIVVG